MKKSIVLCLSLILFFVFLSLPVATQNLNVAQGAEIPSINNVDLADFCARLVVYLEPYPLWSVHNGRLVCYYGRTIWIVCDFYNENDPMREYLFNYYYPILY